MKNLLLGFILLLLAACGQDKSSAGGSFGDFIKPNYSSFVSLRHCTLKPSNSLNSLESFIPSLIERLQKKSIDGVEVFFYFPISDSQTDVSQFELALNYSEATSLDSMNEALETLKFSDIADCNQEQELQNLSKLKIEAFKPAETIIETMSCEYLENYNFATLNLVFEQLISALADATIELELHYLGTDSQEKDFQWVTVFPSLEDRALFLKEWRSLQISAEMQGLLSDQATCNESELFRSYKVI